MLRRREALLAMAAASANPTSLWAGNRPSVDPPSSIGLVIYCCQRQRQARKARDPRDDLFEPRAFLAHCRALGAGGAQVHLGVRDAKDCMDLRRQAESSGTFIEGIVRVPHCEADIERFAAEVETAEKCGALALRTTVIPGRRYESFDTLEKFNEFAKRGRRAVERAAPFVERHRVPLAIENHKDQRTDERVALLEHISSEYVGACIDTGNSVALLEDPLETVRALVPWAHCVHLKDQAVGAYDDGFLLGDIALGRGCLPLVEIVDVLRGEKHHLRFSLELITRDPLRVPVLRESYWATLPDVPATDLARMLNWVRKKGRDDLQMVSSLSFEEQLELEQSNVRLSLQFARDRLGLRATP